MNAYKVPDVKVAFAAGAWGGGKVDTAEDSARSSVGVTYLVATNGNEAQCSSVLEGVRPGDMVCKPTNQHGCFTDAG